ncbi:MAG: hypothetical protein ACRC1P_06440 [Cellulosilyticaceae bacterium]
MEEVLLRILSKLDNLELNQQAIASEVSEINGKVSVIFNQTGSITEFTTATQDSLKRIEKAINSL